MSSKVIGNVDWVIQPDCPELSGKFGDETLFVRITATATGMERNLPQYGDYFVSDDPFFKRYSYLTLTDRTVTLERGKRTYNVTLTYSAADNSGNSTEANVTSDVEYTTQDIDIPLEQHENYRTKWNHVLLARTGTTSSPEWWNDAHTKELTDESAKTYAWARPGDKPPDGWYCLLDEVKPGVEAFRGGICTVTLTQRSANKNYLQRSAGKDYTLQTPPDTFGRGGEWLRGGSQIRKNNRYWELTVAFLNSKEWDRDLYK